ncbi:MAG: ABC transporter permease [Cytophagales bacterium]|nr:ABC transporter permease [Armatimonadota bacterium]
MKQRLLRDLPLLLLTFSLGAAALALIIRLVGASPVAVSKALWDGAFGSRYSLSETLVQTAPLLLTGLGVAVAFRCGLFNIGAEGQFLVGAMAATGVGILKNVPAVIHLPLLLLAGAAAGALWSGIAGLLKVYRGVQEVLSTLLLNFVALQMLSWMVRGPLQEAQKGFPQSDLIAVPARFVLLAPGTRLHAGVLLALFCAALIWFFLRWTAGGFALRAVGSGEGAAEAAGIPVRRTVLATFLLSGALSGLAGAIQISGVTYLLSDGYSPGYGYTAIAVALLANLSPLAVVPSALFFGALTAGSNVVQQRIVGIPSVVVQVLQAVVLLAFLAYAWARERRQRREEGGVA